ncbi:uncharacterized protein PHALS_06142 [Plasmopara halstedii]|uniref:Uncharacterized protein n=1 Tax=Plasmopara halstedii TaxID=4781 RepID=A0A0P1B418_PLAHL|nr:uncharacterized protein PHALS_06142 [Plasmopara halstedii]CEG48314.1 hypothetical protein PHALS_06142 [Plasmopara halstedii]|eukprot:XP_024584683.1 hypothetical protein PHALS_06142 [Plasmopara halstedii]
MHDSLSSKVSVSLEKFGAVKNAPPWSNATSLGLEEGLYPLTTTIEEGTLPADYSDRGT